jgi:hypothetical protein
MDMDFLRTHAKGQLVAIINAMVDIALNTQLDAGLRIEAANFVAQFAWEPDEFGG